MQDLRLASEAHIRIHMRRVLLLVQRYMRLYGERLVDPQGKFTDRCVGVNEIKTTLGVAESRLVQPWLEQIGVPPLPEISDQLTRLDDAASDLVTQFGVALPIERLRHAFGLQPVDMDMLLAAAAPQLRVDIARLYSVAWGDFVQKQCTVGFLVELACYRAPDSAVFPVRCLTPTSPLLAYQLLELHNNPAWPAGASLLHSLVSVPEAVLRAMLGCCPEHTELPGCKLHVQPSVQVLVDPHAENDVRSALESKRLILQGPPGVGKRTLVSKILHESGRRVLEIELNGALQRLGGVNRKSLLEQMGQLLREAQLLNAAALFRLTGCDDRDLARDLERESSGIQRLLACFPGIVVVTLTSSSPLTASLLGDAEEVLVPVPDARGQRMAWARVLERSGTTPTALLVEELSRGYQLTPGGMHRAVEAALAQGARRGMPAEYVLSASNLKTFIRRQLNHRLGWLAEPTQVSMTLNDIVLSDELRKSVEEILAYARHHETVYKQWGFQQCSPTGRGLSALLTGPPGTGKTLLAGVLASELGRVMYRVDLSAVVDKYIGETEKKLAQLFDEAERAQAILLFDEADSLFAKRTSVKSSNDRYANLEVNFLLQRLENFDGIAILTTNLERGIDEAFERRIRFKLKFQEPDAAARALLWQRLMPPRAAVDPDIDWEALGAAYPLTGGHIRNAVLRAAITAAEARQPITADNVHEAALRECRELGLLIRQGGSKEEPELLEEMTPLRLRRVAAEAAQQRRRQRRRTKPTLKNPAHSVAPKQNR